MPYFKQACFSSGEACILSSWLSNQVREEKAPDTIFCSALCPTPCLVIVGTPFLSGVLPETTWCREWVHCLHLLIQWHRLWEGGMPLVAQAKMCKWLYWKSICSRKVLFISEFLTFFFLFFAQARVGRFIAASLRAWSLISFPVFHQEFRVKGSPGVLFCLLLAGRDARPPSLSWQALNRHGGVQLSPTMQSHKWGQFEQAACALETSSKFSRKAVGVPPSSNTKRSGSLLVWERGHIVPYGKCQSSQLSLALTIIIIRTWTSF